jgi:hypothetical protein
MTKDTFITEASNTMIAQHMLIIDTLSVLRDLAAWGSDNNIPEALRKRVNALEPVAAKALGLFKTMASVKYLDDDPFNLSSN